MARTTKATSSPRCLVGVAMGLRERKKLDAWRAIRTAATRLISERGFDAVSIEDIAAEAGVSRTTFFSYFPSKEAAVFDLDPLELQQWRALLAVDQPGTPPWEALTELYVGLARLMPRCLPLQKQVIHQRPELLYAARGSCDDFAADLRGWISRRITDGDELRTALVYNTSLAAFVTAIETWDPTRPADTLLDAVRSCLRAVGTGIVQPVR